MIKNKKGFSLQWETIIIAVIAIVVLLLLLYIINSSVVPSIENLLGLSDVEITVN